MIYFSLSPLFDFFFKLFLRTSFLEVLRVLDTSEVDFCKMLKTQKCFENVLQNVFSSMNFAANVFFFMFMHLCDPNLCQTCHYPTRKQKQCEY